MKLRIRDEPQEGHIAVSTMWLLDGDGVTRCLLHGVVSRTEAAYVEKQFTELGIDVERIEQPFDGCADEPRPETVYGRQKTMAFEQGGTSHNGAEQ